MQYYHMSEFRPLFLIEVPMLKTNFFNPSAKQNFSHSVLHAHAVNFSFPQNNVYCLMVSMVKGLSAVCLFFLVHAILKAC
jgi:hypothetical protein